MTDIARAHHEVDPRRALEDPLPFLLRDATADADRDVALALHFAQASEVREHFLLVHLTAPGFDEEGFHFDVNASKSFFAASNFAFFSANFGAITLSR